jgi:hypothetical protein
MKRSEKLRQSSGSGIIVSDLESLPFLSLYTDGDRIDLLLVWSGVKPATSITLGRLWSIDQKKEDLTEKEIEKARRVFKNAGLAFVEGRKVRRSIRNEKGFVSYQYVAKKFFVAKNIILAKRLMKAENTDDDKTIGQLAGFPKTAVKAYLKSKKISNVLTIKRSELPAAVKNRNYLAFATFYFSKNHWQEELKTPKKWAETIKNLDPQLYEKTVRNYKEIVE